MILFDKKMLDKYMEWDYIYKNLDKDCKYTSNIWLLNSEAKRAIYHYIYGDILFDKKSKYVLDIGGGYTSITEILRTNHNYFLCDIMAHDDINDTIKDFHINKDWHDYNPKSIFDIVIANDLFPNVDQRLEMFLDKYLPITKEIRLSLTYYNTPKYYKVKRTNADEILYFLAWNGEHLKNILNKYVEFIEEPNLDILLNPTLSLFENGRQICIVKLRNHLPTTVATSFCLGLDDGIHTFQEYLYLSECQSCL